MYLTDGTADAKHLFLFAHGAGGAMDTPFMSRVARAIASFGIRVVRFEFPYMAARRTGGRKSAPDRQPVLLETWASVINEHKGPSLFIGGKSMGGRMASMVADQSEVCGLICFGYPFHPPGKPDQLRTAHLEDLRTPALFLQGERDPFGSREEVGNYGLSPAIRIEWMPDGDHSFKPRASSGFTESTQLAKASELAATFMLSQR